MVTLSIRPRSTLDSVGWSVPQRRAASSCVSLRRLMVSPMAVISLLFAVSSAASAGVNPMSANTLPLLFSGEVFFGAIWQNMAYLPYLLKSPWRRPAMRAGKGRDGSGVETRLTL